MKLVEPRCTYGDSPHAFMWECTFEYHEVHEIKRWWYDHVAAVSGMSLTALQMFFFLMFLTTVGTSSTRDIRDAWHAGWWPVKTILWITLIAAPFFIPPQYIEIYGVFPSLIFMHKRRHTCSICRFKRTSKDIDRNNRDYLIPSALSMFSYEWWQILMTLALYVVQGRLQDMELGIFPNNCNSGLQGHGLPKSMW